MNKNKSMALCAALLLAVNLSAGELLMPSFSSIKTSAFGRSPAAPAFTPASYTTETGPAWQGDSILGRMVPQPPPNLKQEQVAALIQRLVDHERTKTGKVTLTKPDVQALVTRLVQIDTHFVDPVDAKKWDAIMKAVGDEMTASYDKNKKWDGAVERGIVTAVTALKDPHTIYFNEAQLKAFMDMMKGSFVGIGASIAEDPKGLKLDFIYPDSGAEKAGIKAGDIIVEVNGAPIAGQKADEIVKKLRGDEGTKLTVTVERDGQKLPPMLVTRKTVKMPTAFSKSLAGGVGYVYWNQFGDDSDTVVLSHVRRLKANGAKSIILDVRGNPGGLVTSVASIASEFVKNGQEIVSFRRQGQVVFKHVAQGDGEFADMPVAVLTDGGSASASEILAAALQDQRKGYVVIGSQSYGKGTQQTILPGNDKGGLKITESRWHRPNGGNIDAQHDTATGEKVPGTGGVTPDISVALPEDQAHKIAQQTAYELMGRKVASPVADPVLEKAVEVLSGATKTST